MDEDIPMTNINTPDQPQFRANIADSQLSTLAKSVHVDVDELIHIFLSCNPDHRDLRAVSDIFRDASVFLARLVSESLTNRTGHEAESALSHNDTQLTQIDPQLLDESHFDDHHEEQDQLYVPVNDEFVSMTSEHFESQDTRDEFNPGRNISRQTPNDDTASDVFDPSGILPDSVIQAEYDKPYNESWMIDHNVPVEELERFKDSCFSRHKWTELFRFGALKVHDEFSIEALSAGGTVVHHHALVTNVGSSAPNKWSPKIAILSARGGYPMIESKYYQQSRKLIEDITGHFYTAKMDDSYNGISVWRNGVNLGTICEVRAKYHLWEVCVRQWARKHNVRPYAGRINWTTG
ncbi:MAG: hypothetical protein Q9225_007972, partial [Loekoesia sp. 1 TL-2023]